MKNQIHKRKRCSIVALRLKYSEPAANPSHFEYKLVLFGNCVPHSKAENDQIARSVVCIFLSI